MTDLTDRWELFEKTLREIGDGPMRDVNGQPRTLPNGDEYLYHEQTIYASEEELEYQAHTISHNGTVPSTIDSINTTHTCDWGSFLEGTRDHPCPFGEYAPIEEPKRLSMGYLCTQCGETWVMRLRTWRQEVPKELWPIVMTDQGRAQLGFFLKSGSKAEGLDDDVREVFEKHVVYPEAPSEEESE